MSEVLHAALECEAKVGGVGSVTLGLMPALAKDGHNVSIVTPGYDVYFKNHFKDKDIEKITTIPHIYKGEVVYSDIFRVKKEVTNATPVYHYLIRPIESSKVARIFEIQRDQNIYQSLEWSQSRNRLEYFNSAIAAMLRLPNDKLPAFDIYHAHTWHTSLGGVLAKEFANLSTWQPLYADQSSLRKIPHMISTIHMLLAREHGQLNNEEDINSLFNSVGLLDNFAQQFSAWRHYINPTQLKQLVLGLLYSDTVTTVSEGLAYETTHGKGQGLDDLFQWLSKQDRLQGILNGINHTKFDATNTHNLGKFTLRLDSLVEDKSKLKDYLAQKYPQLNPKKMWFGFIGRFAAEKGMDMLQTALQAVKQQDGIFIIMGSHVVTKMQDGKKVPFYQDLIDDLRKKSNVLVIDDPAEQEQVGAMIRAAMDCVMMLSHNEACGLPQMEGFANAAFAIGPRIQGLPDSIKDLAQDPENGSGFLYCDEPELRKANLQAVIGKAANFYRNHKDNGTLNDFLKHILQYSKQFDWNANPREKYLRLYTKVISKSLLTFDKIRNAKLQTVPKYNATRNQNGKIFQIGFNKCGTQMLYTGFKANNVPSIHYGFKGKTLASIIKDNSIKQLPLLHGIDQFTAYFDMEDIYHNPPLFIAQDLYRELDRQYPGSKFILNTRDRDAWIKSRLSHLDPITNQRYSEVLCAHYQCTHNELISRWEQEWDEHLKSVREYFKDRPQDLLEYELNTDNPEKICNFFKGFRQGVNLDPSQFKIVNQTPIDKKQISNAGIRH